MITDVAGAISGYYKQIYIATRELLALKDHTSSVGIECGSDIRIFHSENMQESIEVKFYKSKIGIYSSEISRTIYNFYWNSYNDVRLIFDSNTEIPRSNIFEEDADEYTLSASSKKQFILHSLIKYHLNQNKRHKIKLKSYFKQYETICNKCTSFHCDECISNFVKKNIDCYPTAFEGIIDINKNVNIEEFSSKIQFVFENKDKLESIAIIKNKLLQIIKTNYEEYVSKMTDLILEAIIHRIALSFLDTTVFNSLIKKAESNNYNKHKKLSRRDVIGYINSYEDFLNEYKEDILELKLLDLVEKANLNKEEMLFKFNKEYEEYLSSKEVIDVYDSSSIKEYFRSIGMKFKSDGEGNNVIERLSCTMRV